MLKFVLKFVYSLFSTVIIFTFRSCLLFVLIVRFICLFWIVVKDGFFIIFGIFGSVCDAITDRNAHFFIIS
jgi:hypothetical protein